MVYIVYSTDPDGSEHETDFYDYSIAENCANRLEEVGCVCVIKEALIH